MKYTASIGFRLLASVVVTALIALFTLETITINRLQSGLKIQNEELGKLSENLLVQRFHGEAHLARDVVEKLASDFQKQVFTSAQRAQIAKAVLSGNDVTINESLKGAVKDSEIDFLIAFDEKGSTTGSSEARGLLLLSQALKGQDFLKNLKPIITDNSRSKPTTHFELADLGTNFAKFVQPNLKNSFGYVAIAPIFDDFGETIGGLAGFRFIKAEEASLTKFGKLAHSDIFILMEKNLLSRTDGDKITNAKLTYFHALADGTKETELMRSSEEPFMGYCAPYLQLHLCVVNPTAEVVKLRDSMSEIGRTQTSALQLILFGVAAIIMAALTSVLFFAVRHAMTGLPELSNAANDVAKGNLNVPFKPAGIGEIRELSVAFERMLRNLRQQSAKVNQLAYFDSVTGLANREKLQEESRKFFLPAAENSSSVMMIIDLERFKLINDNFGMKAGDYVLKKTAERITHIFDFFAKHNRIANYTAARTGGDDFVIIFSTLAPKEEITKLCEIIISSLAKPLRFGSSSIITNVKIGLTFFKKDGVNFDELMTHTILALDSIREKTTTSYAFFELPMAIASQERIELESELRLALNDKSLTVFYQPKVSCDDGRITGSEALIRWIHPKKGFISPAKFIPIAEEAGLIGEIGRFVLDRAMQETKIMLDAGHDVSVAVNVSALQLEDPNFTKEVLEIITRYTFPFKNLELEITESMAMSDPEGVKARILQLRSKGIKFSMDDFGTGYSNLSQLAGMPIDVLKIDRSLIMNVDEDLKKQALARSILALAREFGFKTVVEGVEKAGELLFCLQNDAALVQGFIFSGAVPLDKYQKFFENTLTMRPHFKDTFEMIGGARNEWVIPPIQLIHSPKIDVYEQTHS